MRQDAITATESDRKKKGEKLLKAVDKMLTKRKPHSSVKQSFS